MRFGVPRRMLATNAESESRGLATAFFLPIRPSLSLEVWTKKRKESTWRTRNLICVLSRKNSQPLRKAVKGEEVPCPLGKVDLRRRGVLYMKTYCDTRSQSLPQQIFVPLHHIRARSLRRFFGFSDETGIRTGAFSPSSNERSASFIETYRSSSDSRTVPDESSVGPSK